MSSPSVVLIIKQTKVPETNQLGSCNQPQILIVRFDGPTNQ